MTVNDKNAIGSIKGDYLQLTASLVQTVPDVADVSGRLEHVFNGVKGFDDMTCAGPPDLVTSTPTRELERLQAFIMSDINVACK